MGAYVPAAAAAGERCTSATGSIKVSPALKENGAHVHQLKFKGTVSGCTGKYAGGGLGFIFHGNKEINCTALTGPPETEDFNNGLGSAEWVRRGASAGFEHVDMGFTGIEEVGMTGEVREGPGEPVMHLKAKLSLKFGPCGGKAKVKKGTFTFSEFVIE
jgi:hypothetical protein